MAHENKSEELQSSKEDEATGKLKADPPVCGKDNGASPSSAPPDGGYAWIILGASFFINFLLDGVCFSFGIFFLEFLDYYDESKETTSWVGSVLNGMYLSIGPVVGAFANRFGCRAVTIFGSILTSASLLASIFSPNIYVLILTYGLLTGVGFGLMYLPSIVMVGYYFEKRRAFATGIAVSASGIGAFVFAPLCETLIATYSWKGATLILSGVCLNGIVCGLLFIPVEDRPGRQCRTSKKSLAVHVQMASVHEGSDSEVQNERMENFAEECRDPSTVPLMQSLVKSGSKDNGISQKNNISSTSLPQKMAVKKEGQGCCIMEKTSCQSLGNTLKRMLDFSLLRNPVFCIYGCSCFLCMTGFFVPFTYLPDMAITFSMSRDQAAFLVSIIGIANTIARVACGWVSDRSWADCLMINNCALVIGGVTTMLSPFCITYPLLGAYSFVFGSCIAAFVSLRSIIMVELMGLEKLTSAFGLVTLCQGLSSFIGAPIAGALFDVTGYYNYSFYVAGSTLALAGVICFPLRRIAAWWNKRTLKKTLMGADVIEHDVLSSSKDSAAKQLINGDVDNADV